MIAPILSQGQLKSIDSSVISRVQWVRSFPVVAAELRIQIPPSSTWPPPVIPTCIALVESLLILRPSENTAGKIMLPNFLVIGAPRSGTTWIDANLRRHPDVFMPTIKELHFFDRHYERGMEFYESYFSAHCGQRAVGEATPAYLHGEYSENDIPALIFKHMPNVRLIACLRNPIERVYSRYWNSKAKFDQNIHKSFEQKLLDKPEFISEGFYYDQLKRYLAYFPRDQILILLYEQIAVDPVGFMQRIYRFVGVDDGFTSGLETEKVNAAAGKGHLANSKVLFFLSRALASANLLHLSEKIRRLNSRPLPPMSSETRRILLETYRDKNLQLQTLIDSDISHWSQLNDD